MARMRALVCGVLLIVAACGGDGDSAAEADPAGSERFCEITEVLDEGRDRWVQAGTPEAFEAYLQLEMSLVAEAGDVVPAAIRDDFTALMARERALMPVYEAAGFDLARVDRDALDAAAAANPMPDGAGLRIQGWIDDNC